MKIILTGGTGFLGSSFLHKLLFSNNEVVLLKRSFSNLDRIHSVLGHSNLTLFDVDKGNLEDVFATRDVDVIVHLATEYGRAGFSISPILEANLIFPIKLIEFAIKYGVTSFVNTDSYFNKGSVVYSYLHNYSLSKKILTSYLHQFSDRIYIANVVLEHIYGPGDSNAKFVERIIQDIAIKQVARIPLTQGHQRRDFIYVDDVLDAYMIIINHAKKQKVGYETFELGTGESVEVCTFVKTIKSISKSQSKLAFGDIDYREDEIMESIADNFSLRALGWEPRISIHAGLSKLINLYRAHVDA